MIVALPVHPVRQIDVVQTREGYWQGIFVGDSWTPAFKTGIGSRKLVWEALRHRRRGLPIVAPGARQFPFPQGRRPGLDHDCASDHPRPAA